MKVESIAGFATISDNPKASHQLYEGALGLTMKQMGEYRCLDRFPGCNHFGVWPLKMAAETCFGSAQWPEDVAIPSATIEFELGSHNAVIQAVEELKSEGQVFIHETKVEDWGQTMARFMSPENILIGLSYSPWLHDD